MTIRSAIRYVIAVIRRRGCGNVLARDMGGNFYKADDDNRDIVCDRPDHHPGPHCCWTWTPVMRFRGPGKIGDREYRLGPGRIWWADGQRATVNMEDLYRMPRAIAKDRQS